MNFTKLDNFLDSMLDIGIPGFDFILYHKGECVHRHMNGYHEIEGKTPMNGEEYYNIYSCTKMITCTAAMQLIERGKLSLDDKLYTYLPEFEHMTVNDGGVIRDAVNHITIRNLFSMTAGLSYNCESGYIKKGVADGAKTTRDIMKYIAMEPLLYEPGEGYTYSLAHDVLAAVVEVVSGDKFREYVKKNIFDVCGMTHSTYHPTESDKAKITEQYRIDAETGEIHNVGKDLCCYRLAEDYESGGAGLVSTVDDYIKFLEALRTGKILKKESVKLFSTYKINDVQYKMFESIMQHIVDFGYTYGLGVRVSNGNGLTDFGWDGAAGAFYGIDLENETTFYFAIHVLGLVADREHKQFNLPVLVKEAITE